MSVRILIGDCRERLRDPPARHMACCETAVTEGSSAMDGGEAVSISLALEDHTDFVCAICRRTICMRWNCGKCDKIIAPLCYSCEGGYKARGRPIHGAFRDRREVVRGFALAEALHTEAVWQAHGWRSPYANA